jgi:UDP-N-acetyl-D-glucosamine dehydrogenase
MLRFTEVGFPVLGFDVDEVKVAKLKNGESYIGHIPSAAIAEKREQKVQLGGGKTVPLLDATSDYSRASEADVVILCVPTPLNRHREPDLSFVCHTIESLQPYLRRGQMISLESTTYPGTTEEELRSRIEKFGFIIGKDVFLVYSPEREDPGNPIYNFELQSVELTPESLQHVDCVLLITDHDDFPYDLIAANASLIVDTRGVYRDDEPNVVKA